MLAGAKESLRSAGWHTERDKCFVLVDSVLLGKICAAHGILLFSDTLCSGQADTSECLLREGFFTPGRFEVH